MLYRPEKSSQSNTASSSFQRSQNNRSGIEHGHEIEQQSDVSSISMSSSRRQAQSADVLPTLSGKTKNVSLTA
jgi:hypothetical protein